MRTSSLLFLHASIFALLLCFATHTLRSQTSDLQRADSNTRPVGTVTGLVIDAQSQSPIAGARALIVGSKLGAITNGQGRFVIKNVPAGVYGVQVSGTGYSPFIQSDVVVSTGKPYNIVVQLQQSIVSIAETEVVASYFQKNVETISSTQTLNAEDVRRAPGVQEDVVRAVALLPGVGVTQAGRNDLVVRGGAPFENLFVVDGIEVPNINHFGSQGSTGGPLSIINIDFVRNVNFSAGGFGPRFGDRVSSLTEITLRDGSTEKHGGELNLSATGFGVIGEGPIGTSGSYLFSVRRSYLDLIFKAAGFSFIPQYWDFQGKISFDLDPSNKLSFLTIGALNTIEFNNETADQRIDNAQIQAPEQNQYFSGLTWKHLNENGYLNVTLGRTFTAFDTRQRDSSLTEVFKNVSDEGETSLRTDYFWQISPNTEIIVGNVMKFASALRYDVLIPGFARLDNNSTPVPLALDSSFTAFRNGTHASVSTYLGENLRLVAGLRADYYGFLSENFVVAPRLSGSYALTSTSTFNFTVGRYYQPPSFIWLVGSPDNGPSLKPIRADQIIAGFEQIVASDLKFQAEVYYKWYDSYPGRVFRPQAVLSPSGFDDITNDIPFGLEPLLSTGQGWARGFELFLQKKLSEIPLYGLMTFTFNETRFTGLDGLERPGSFDNRIIFNVAAGYRFGSDWELSAKFRLATGLPYTPFTPDGRLDFTRFNEGGRLPTFHALDARLDKRWNFESVQLVTYIDIQNLYGQKNVSNLRWDLAEQRAVFNESIGLLPSIGVNIEF